MKSEAFAIGSYPASKGSRIISDRKVFMAVEFPDPEGKGFVVDAEEGCLLGENDLLGQHQHSSALVSAGETCVTVLATDAAGVVWRIDRFVSGASSPHRQRCSLPHG